MAREDSFILMGVGGFFILLGIGLTFWGMSEDRGYYNSLARRFDLREFLQHDPERAWLGALRIGGWISLAVGVVMLASGGAFLLMG